MKSDFSQYYSNFTQPLMQLIMNNADLTLKIKAIETMGFVLTSLDAES